MTTSISTYDYGIPLNSSLSIKNLLFKRAIPNYVIPVPTAGYKVFACMDCGDKFLFESSYKYHIQRKSAKITYVCRVCGQKKIFFNRCNMLAHIRSHAVNFKTATINITDLTIEPIPMNNFMKFFEKFTLYNDSLEHGTINCFECELQLHFYDNNIDKARSIHYNLKLMKPTHCPLCLYPFTTNCALLAHLRLHMKVLPFLCPDCGKDLHESNVTYPYVHSCANFSAMKNSARASCNQKDCITFHPSEYKQHIQNYHMKKVFKCSMCYVACFDKQLLKKHQQVHKSSTISSFYHCQLCPGKLVINESLSSHLTVHDLDIPELVHQCNVCSQIYFKSAVELLKHHVTEHNPSLQQLYKSIVRMTETANDDTSSTDKVKNYRVVKQCEQCKRSFIYKCKYEQIDMLPNECPYKCKVQQSPPTSTATVKYISCHICKNKISDNWEEIKKHYNAYHKEHQCVDIMVVVPKTDITKYLNVKSKNTVKRLKKKSKGRKNTRNNELGKNKTGKNSLNTTNNLVKKNSTDFLCLKCKLNFENKNLFEQHLLIHRDQCMAYQCMDCGQCFVVKPSFSKHLLIEHNIIDVEKYITEKRCYNENALMKYQVNPVVDEPLAENQCKICREQFENTDDLEKHFRVHGMAFLMKNNRNGSP